MGGEVLGLRLELLLMGWVFWVAFALAIVLLAFAVWRGADDGFGFSAGIGCLLAAVTAVVVGIAWLFAAFPYGWQYQQVYRVSGDVVSVSNGFGSDGGDLTYRAYVVKLDGHHVLYQLSDPRAVELDGKHVDLTCEVEYVYQAADRWNCTIAQVS